MSLVQIFLTPLQRPWHNVPLVFGPLRRRCAANSSTTPPVSVCTAAGEQTALPRIKICAKSRSVALVAPCAHCMLCVCWRTRYHRVALAPLVMNISLHTPETAYIGRNLRLLPSFPSTPPVWHLRCFPRMFLRVCRPPPSATAAFCYFLPFHCLHLVAVMPHMLQLCFPAAAGSARGVPTPLHCICHTRSHVRSVVFCRHTHRPTFNTPAKFGANQSRFATVVLT